MPESCHQGILQPRTFATRNFATSDFCHLGLLSPGIFHQDLTYTTSVQDILSVRISATNLFTKLRAQGNKKCKHWATLVCSKTAQTNKLFKLFNPLMPSVHKSVHWKMSCNCQTISNTTVYHNDLCSLISYLVSYKRKLLYFQASYHNFSY